MTARNRADLLMPSARRPLLIAHGGGDVLSGGDIGEGIERAIAAGVEMVEIDVRRTADGVLVVHHGGDPGTASLGSLRYADLAGWRIPTLDEVLERVAGRVGVNAELKETGYEDAVVAACLAAVPSERLLLSSFLDDAVAAVRRADAELATGLIVGQRPSSIGGAARDALPFDRLKDCDADVLVSSRPLDYTGIRARAARRGVPVIVWTVNKPAALGGALGDERVLGVITDRYDLARRP